MISDEQFFAWLDGELEPAEAAAIDSSSPPTRRCSAGPRRTGRWPGG